MQDFVCIYLLGYLSFEMICSDVSSACIDAEGKPVDSELLEYSSTRPKSAGHDVQASSAGSAGYQLGTPTYPEEEHTNVTIEEIVKLGDDCLGLKIVLTTREASYMGVINYILPASRRLALEKVCNPKTGKKRVGMLTVFFHNILNISVIGEDKEARQRLLKDAYHEDNRGKQLLMKKLVPPHLVDLGEHANQVDDDVLLGRVQLKPLSKGCSISKDKQDTPPPPPRIPRPAKWVVIDTIGDAFKKALSFIHTENVIAMGMEGLNIGRSGTLAWLSAATSTVIFLFDMAKMGASEAFQEGLGDIIEDSTIMKVVHDCRAIEDMLHHQFSINFNNVFDTQAAEVYVYMLNHRGSVPCFVSGLPSLLVRYLGLSPHHLFFSHVRQECAQDDESVWMERPLPTHLCDGLARSVMYLRELRLELLDLILVDLAQVTNLYLGAVRDKDSTAAKSLEPHVVPAEVQRLARRSVINHVGVYDPYITYSRDALKIAPQRK